MPVGFGDSEKDLIAALFNDDPRKILDFLETLSLAMEEGEPEFAKTWSKLAKNLKKAADDLDPLYRRPLYRKT